MRVLSLFDGMACGYIAFNNLNIDITNYDAYEIDKYAIKVATYNFQDIVEHGDVFQADFTKYKGYDWLIGGSPCTYWSIAKTKDREKFARGMGWGLFSQYVRALHEAKPKYFLYENNKSMSNEIRKSIDDAFGFEAICVNSALVSAQNRHRLYWVGIRQDDGTYIKADIQQPDDRGILLRGILETSTNEKCYCMAEPIRNSSDQEVDLIFEHQLQVSGSIRIGTIENNLQNKEHDSKQYRVYSPDGKSTTICGQGGGVGAKTGLYACPTFDKSTNVYEVKDGYITIKDKQYPIKLSDGFYIIRKLTVTECKRLQTVPEWYDMSVISNSQCYKCLGNGWTVDVISHLISQTMQNDL